MSEQGGEGRPGLRIDREALSRAFVLVTLGFLLYQLALIFWPFLATLMAAATLVYVFQPVHRRLHSWVGGRDGLAAVLGSVLLLALIILPALGAAWLLAGELAAAIPMLKAMVVQVQEGGATSLAKALPHGLAAQLDQLNAHVVRWGIDLHEVLMTGLERVGAFASSLAARFVKNLLWIALNTAILGIAVFFFLRDGRRWVRSVAELLPLEPPHVERVLDRLDLTLSAVVRGQFVTALVQGTLATIGFLVAGLPSPVLLGCATAFSALIPIVGAAGVWAPSAVFLLLTGSAGAGLFLVIWGALVVSLVDNFLRPKLIGSRAHIPTFLLLVGILGGIRVYGLLGVVVGPLMIGLLLTFVGIYREEIAVRR